ncbi:unnamed protein product [Camellia sinensis]
MASETLEDKKQEEIANVEDKGEVKEEGKTEEGEEEKEVEKKEEDTEMAEKEEPEVTGEESKEEAEEVSKKAKRGRKASSKKAAKDEKAAKSEPGSKEPVTPIERPIRERKTVERYSELSTGRSASKALSIEKGQGTQLKDIPNGLRGNSLTGTLSPDMCQLTGLCDVRGNNLTGTIPDNIGNCTSFEILYISYNQISGEIPYNIGFLQVATLSLQGNRLTGKIPEVIGLMQALAVFEVTKKAQEEASEHVRCLEEDLEKLSVQVFC